jgi:hypothetical protein
MRILAALLLVASGAVAATRVVTSSGDTAWNVFRRNSDGVLVYVEISTAAYAALGAPGATQPTRGGATWVYSYMGPLFNTPERRFVDGDAYDVNGAVVAQIAGSVHILPGARVQGGIVTSTHTYQNVEVRPDGEIVERQAQGAGASMREGGR